MNVPWSWLLTFFEDGPTNHLLAALTERVQRGAPEGALSGAELEAAQLEKLTELLDSLGLSVERVVERPAAPAGVVVAEVRAVAPVAASDHLLVAEVWDGHETRQVVTGAPNTAVGLRTALAKPGATLPAVGLAVAVREVAGVRSEGVLCSPRELGLYDHAGGLIAFGEDAPVGAALAALWPQETVIELELTPNRADAFSLLGVARDLAAKLGVPYRHPADGLPLGDPASEDGLSVRVDDPAACPRFVLRRVDGVSVGPSPLWLQRRLAALGLRPRNNLVDVTNYVTFELGQPSHAYDVADLTGGAVVVRRAAAGERLLALTEEELALSPENLLITTPRAPSAEGATQPIGLAGVIGGAHHSVKPTTTAVALEVAHFDPVTIRKSAKRLGLVTDARTRFERGVDPNLPPVAAARAAQLMAEVGGGRVHPGRTEFGGDAPPKRVAFRPARVPFLTALEVPEEVQRRFLAGLGCRVTERGERWEVLVPSWRFDLAIEDDLVEEVARLYGYEHIPQTVPVMDFIPAGADTTHRGLRTLLASMGFQEVMTYSFTGALELERARAPAARVRLAHPPSSERSVLRTALYPGLLAAARGSRGERLALFEVGRVFVEDELERLALLLRGPWAELPWSPAALAGDFYTFKGLLEGLAETLGATLRLEPAPHPALHPGVSASAFWNGREVGFVGQLHPEVAAQFALEATFVAELTLPLEGREAPFRDFSRQPFAERDLAIIAPAEVTYAQLAALAREAAGAWLESVAPFDVYAGPPIPEGERSVALRLRFRHPERALEGDEVDSYMARLIDALAREGYSIRDR
ncbi:phenylalanine--tRNA ligase subunit beta [Truepera radiovictrix]|uniref:Phenylalanine--tRNA ligase beta subunit n=1 Tax=Truepera radiovictrix (strain DSM 17093 / CIP 108686 / LMG 22925 / RQ-24) TaxID=649638 RepID=D7CWW7_TRURR|nr:phenylalanine--tRNA ligase subunit beta [Truepera radiovictrix]ADI14475.1 phenylalanyl-tRNA synthetase, beta subunit [Truepera radiovictrix DSM 17093]WMT56970.1 phenylalanine--tRNA ligase subunit beta [Truepera radiovictrix]